ncbi:type IV toxin-antitoxin system AbiEi family antitoxin [Brumicola nitratireducens]|uniref:Transcriptional regulator AbiEi antitoxin N-terminal domain-containing protein n=1 Tax=Glaciecola nitratireducens (strain JCM 12485 / KCTC 12276 / FR1064) TaxID=1085623 RepID=G4QKY4_GLANF|nr:type IV toxin-antitoxin system AbiEi family antitoxin [Glaciecola nitratireducens]AEP29374.1 hypothetical protein GNIT_1250 [Glaciecola nitratireducens FR1064]
MNSKLNLLVNEFSPGSVVLQQWLGQNGISHSLAQKYVQNGWLERLANGVFYRPQKDPKVLPTWATVLSALMYQTDIKVHLAGLSSLQQQGLSHYLSLNSTNTTNQLKNKVWIGTDGKQTLPKWFREFCQVEWIYCKNKVDNQHVKACIPITVNGKALLASSAELAAFEVVSAIGRDISFEHVAELFQGLVNLSPRKVQTILASSKAIQANRVFLFLGHYYEHQWVKRIDESVVNLGAGKRQVVANGHYDRQYKITVPSDFRFH